MDCVRFGLALIEQLEGTVEAADEERMSTHAASCRECQGLQAAVRGSVPVAEPADLTASILAMTSGSACARAQQLGSERAGAALYEADEALDLHLQACAECSALVLALDRLRQELPLMAELAPDENLVDEVLALTSHRPAGRRRWDRIAGRPRLAMEGAYAGTLALFLAVGFPGAPLADVPSRLQAGLSQQCSEVREAVVAGASQLTIAGSATWVESAQWLTDYADFRAWQTGARDGWNDIREGWRRAGEERLARSWRTHVKPVIESIDRLRRQARALIGADQQRRTQDDGTTRTDL